ncbi:MAG TPA: hypothetical protein HPP80_02075 [Rhodospirillaceae bacterium]|nr:hypothetical protein [Rhodospirillaceae bacterium]
MVDQAEGLLLAEGLCARLCHDLAGPVGALATGAELLSEEAGGGGADDEALQLLTSSAAVAAHRLRFFRLAFGGGGKAVEARSLRELVSSYVACSVTAGQNLSLDWRDESQEPWRDGRAQLLLNLILLARDCLPGGGQIRLSARPAAAILAEITVEGPTAKTGEAAGGLADGPLDAMPPRAAQGVFTRWLARRLGYGVTLAEAQNRVTLCCKAI